jgi:GYF domain 2
MNHAELLAQAEQRAAKREAAKASPGKAEWYVGIDGQPVGPVDKAYLKSQIDAGKVTPQSLVWREELTDWKPLNNFPELRELVAAKIVVATPTGAASAPVALTRSKAPEPAPPSPRLSSPGPSSPRPGSPRPSGPGPSSPRPGSPRPSGPGPSSPRPSSPQPGSPRPSAPRDAAPSSPRVPQPAIATKIGTKPEADEPPPSTAVPIGLAGLAPPPSRRPDAIQSTVKAEPPFVATPAPKPEPKPEPPPASVPELDDDDLALAGIPADRRRKGRGISPMAFAFIAMATAFGAVSAWFIFGQATGDGRVAEGPDSGVTAPTTSGVPQAGGTTPEVGPSASANEPDNGSGGSASGSSPSGGGKVGTTGGGPKPSGSGKAGDDDGGKTEPPPPNTPCDPDDPFCSGGPTGPKQNDDDGGGSESGTGLSPGQAQAAVARNKGSLMRRCRSMVGEGSAKVGATIVVGSSGSVKSVATSGGSKSPGLASCVKSRIKNWSFPPSGGSTTINVAFNFL